ncbi:MAG: substrate-binding domain-containing protein [Aeoliella sp.]
MPSESETQLTKHGRLHSFLAEQITSGEVGGGEFLPSEPMLAKRFDISRGTVRQALAKLQNDGLVERIPGKGTLVRSLVSEHQPITAVEKRAALSVFAVLLPELRTGHYPALVQSFDEAASEFHHQTMFCATGNDVRRQGDIILQLIDKNIAGVALSPPTVGAPPVHQIRQLQNNGIPVVLLHRGVEGIAVPVVAISYEQIAEMAVEALIERGHRNIAYVVSHQGQGPERYHEAIADTMERHGLELHPELVRFGKSPMGPTGAPTAERLAEVEAALEQMMALPPDLRPTAAFDPWDADAEAIYLALIHQGKKIPEDFSLISFGGATRSGTLAARITSVTLDEHTFSSQAVRLLESMHRGKEPIANNRRYQVGVQLFAGQTLGDAPQVGI